MKTVFFILFFALALVKSTDPAQPPAQTREEKCEFDYGRGVLKCCPLSASGQVSKDDECFEDKIYEKQPICEEKKEECQDVNTCCFEGNRGTIKVKSNCFVVYKQTPCGKSTSQAPSPRKTTIGV